MGGSKRISRVVIVGGGTAGWMAAAPLAQLFASSTGERCQIVLVESPDIGTVGVGEATLPPIRNYNQSLGIDDADFVRRTQGSFKLGIEFKDWGWLGNRFFHGFGDYGPAQDGRSGYMHWLRLRQQQENLASYEEWSVATQLALKNRFTPPSGNADNPSSWYSYAYHFDASLYAAYLRDYALQRGVERIEGTVAEVLKRPTDGFISGLRLSDGRIIEGDLFVDCTGFRALLIAGEMKAEYDDWSAWLPCNSALAVPTKRIEPLNPYTTTTAREAGWQWRIPLQHRTGNGYVYCSGFSTDERAEQVLMQNLDAPALACARPLRFTAGRRSRSWVKNVVAIGLSGGFLEPLESTSIQVIMDAIGRLIQFFPDKDFAPELAAEFNRKMNKQYESFRDFIILHYKLTQRTDAELWRYCASMPIPDTLAHQIELFQATGRVTILDPEGFAEPSWVAIFLGLGATPRTLDPFAERIPIDWLKQYSQRLPQAIAQLVNSTPTHAAYLEKHAKAPDLG